MENWRSHLNEAFYRVRPGDNLTKILRFIEDQIDSDRKPGNVKSLAKLNPQIKNINKIYPGQYLRVTYPDAEGESLAEPSKTSRAREQDSKAPVDEFALFLKKHADEIWKKVIDKTFNLMIENISDKNLKYFASKLKSGEIPANYHRVLPTGETTWSAYWHNGYQIGQLKFADMKAAAAQFPGWAPKGNLVVNRKHYHNLITRLIRVFRDNSKMFAQITDPIRTGAINFIVDLSAWRLSILFAHELTHTWHNWLLILQVNKGNLSVISQWHDPTSDADLELQCIGAGNKHMLELEPHRIRIIKDIEHWTRPSGDDTPQSLTDPKASSTFQKALEREAMRVIESAKRYAHKKRNQLTPTDPRYLAKEPKPRVLDMGAIHVKGRR